MSLIEIKNLSKIYNTGVIKVNALSNIELCIENGEFISIMGASGSGKSTLMGILGCLDKQTSGKYFLEGIDIATLDDASLSEIRNEKIGFVFQSFNLLPRLSTLKNVEMPMLYCGVSADKRKKRALEVLKKVGLEDRVYHKPNELSGGQKQRVAIARALVNNPSIIFADEPTGNLDTTSSGEIMEIFKQLNAEGNTVIIVTHELDVAKYADKIIHFRDGMIIN